MIRFKILILFLSLFLFTNVNADVVKKIIINGNERISKDTIVSFSGVQINDILNQNETSSSYPRNKEIFVFVWESWSLYSIRMYIDKTFLRHNS